jgi:glycosyltransferase involved in cell wall biosynthesis
MTIPISTARPLLTFAVGAYNQEAYIREAVEAAFAQTYSPLEIILSDDCSKDRTFEIIQETARSYRGPHTVIVRRNQRNLGLIGHCNEVIRVARGELFVCAAGDDVSLPERTEMSFRAWEDSQRRSASIWGDYIVTDEKGVEMGDSGLRHTLGTDRGFHHMQLDPVDFAGCRSRKVYGCTHAFNVNVFRRFGDLPLLPGFVNEDATINFRSVLAGNSVTFISKPLVRYRRHSQNVSTSFIVTGREHKHSFEIEEQKRRRTVGQLAAACECYHHDIDTALARGMVSADMHKRLKAAAHKSLNMYRTQEKLIGSDTVVALGLILKLARLGCKRAVLGELPRVLPYSWYRWWSQRQGLSEAA